MGFNLIFHLEAQGCELLREGGKFKTKFGAYGSQVVSSKGCGV